MAKFSQAGTLKYMVHETLYFSQVTLGAIRCGRAESDIKDFSSV